MNKLYNENNIKIHEKLASNINLSLRKRHSKKDASEHFHRPAKVVNIYECP
jgi:hypothetical protein